MSIHSPERGKKKRKKNAQICTHALTQNISKLPSMWLMASGETDAVVLHARSFTEGSQSHGVDQLHTLHGDSITSCSLDAADWNPLLKQRLCAVTSATLLDATGTTGGNTAPLSAETLSPQRTQNCSVLAFKWLQIQSNCNNFYFFISLNLPNVE